MQTKTENHNENLAIDGSFPKRLWDVDAPDVHRAAAGLPMQTAVKAGLKIKRSD